MNDRIREVRKALKMTMDAFGQRIGVAKSTISNIENGSRNVSEHMAKSICREFNVNYEWLTTGDGEMFTDLPQTVLDELCQQYNLDDFDRTLMQMYISLTDAERGLLKAKMKKMIHDLGYRKDGDLEED
ncbi:MAG: helix-turn-helix transcriptional regulator [Subdoligranulum sp.]|nr:helix-turn-helix transcriptional regulator [Subdoligranulum sp.]